MKREFNWTQVLFFPVVASLTASYIFYLIAKDFWTSSILLGGVFLMALVSYLIGLFVVRFFVLANQTGVSKVYADQAKASSDIKRALSASSKIDVLAIRGLGIASLKDSLVQSAARSSFAGKSVRVAYMADDSPYATTRAQELAESMPEFRNALRAGYSGVTGLAKIPGIDVQLRAYKNAPTWRIIRADDIMFVSGYLKDKHGHESAVHRITRTGDNSLFPVFERHFLDIWNSATLVSEE